MPAPSTIFRNKEVTLSACSHDGQFVLAESQGSGVSGSGLPGGGGNYKLNSFAQFTFCTGGANGYIADITPAASGTQSLVSALRCPLNMRPYLTRLDMDVQGAISWNCTSPNGVPFVQIQDTNGTPLVHAPFNAFKSFGALTFPDSDVECPMLLGPVSVAAFMGTPIATFTYSAGVITASQPVFLGSNLMAGTVVQILDGTGKGQSATVTASTTTTLTISPAFPTPPDTMTSVVGVFYQPLSAYGNSTSITLANGGGTPYNVNALDNGFAVVGVVGAGAGTCRQILANTNAGMCTLNGALNTAMNTTTTLVMVTNESNMDGSVDLSCDAKWTVAQPNTGIQVQINLQGGTAPLGSAVRIYGEGYWGY